jgi:putative ABC transport system permease protein
VISQLPRYSSAPSTLITARQMQALGLSALPTGWLIQTPHPLTASQISSARRTAAAAGLAIETRTAQNSLNGLRDWSTVAGIILALGVLGMTVGLIRSETGRDLMTLTATGARSTTRRSLTGVTAGALAFLGAAIGTAGAYAALLCWHRSDLRPLGHVPTANLVLILVGLPLIATVGGWLLAGRDRPDISRQPLE